MTTTDIKVPELSMLASILESNFCKSNPGLSGHDAQVGPTPPPALLYPDLGGERSLNALIPNFLDTSATSFSAL
jgi:hypothetical protein